MTVDPSEPSADYKKRQIAELIHLTEEQRTIIDLYLLEEKTGMRHWQLDPEDPNVYMEWMNGTNLLRNKVTARVNMTKAQKIAMNNNSKSQQSRNGNNTQQSQQQQLSQTTGERIIRTSSGKEIPASERPDLDRAAHKPKGRYPRRSR